MDQSYDDLTSLAFEVQEDESRFEELWSATKRIRNYAIKKFRNVDRDDVDSAIHLATLKALRAFSAGQVPFGRFLMLAIDNAIKDEFPRATQVPRPEITLAGDFDAEFADDRDHERESDLKELNGILREAIDHYVAEIEDPDDRVILRMVLENNATEDIAAETGLVRDYVYRRRRRLWNGFTTWVRRRSSYMDALESFLEGE